MEKERQDDLACLLLFAGRRATVGFAQISSANGACWVHNFSWRVAFVVYALLFYLRGSFLLFTYN
jgi:hypothetical protein